MKLYKKRYVLTLLIAAAALGCARYEVTRRPATANPPADHQEIGQPKVDGGLVISANPDHVYVGQAVQFRADCYDNTRIVIDWNYADGSPTIREQNPTHAFAAVGTYQVNALCTAEGRTTLSQSVSVTVVAAPVTPSNPCDPCQTPAQIPR